MMSFQKKVEVEQQKMVDNVLMNPIEKYVKYNIHPYSFFIHLILVIFVSLTVIGLDSQYGQHEKNQLLLFQNLIFQQSDYNEKPFYSLQQFQQHLLFFRNVFYEKDEVYFQNVDFSKTKSYFCIFYTQKVQVYDVDFKNNITNPFEIDNMSQIKRELMKMEYFQLKVDNIWISLKQQNTVYRIGWNLTVHYDISEQGYVKGRLEYARNDGKPNMTDNSNTTVHGLSSIQNTDIYQTLFEGKRNIYLYVIIFCLAQVSLYSNLKFIFNTIDMYMQLRILKTFRNQDEFEEEQEELQDQFQK